MPVCVDQNKQEKKKSDKYSPTAPAMKWDQWPPRFGFFSSIHFLVDSITPKYVAPVASDPVNPGVTPL